MAIVSFILRKTATYCSEASGTSGSYEYIDLGLSSGTKWARCNVGASSPTESGDRFALGETKTKQEFTEENYSSTVKYNNFSSEKITLPSDADAATVNWGAEWCLPTEEQFQELIDECTWEYCSEDVVIGYKIKGPNGNTIFLPHNGDVRCSGRYKRHEAAGCSYYRSSTVGSLLQYDEYRYYIGNLFWDWDGYSVRAVCK